MDRHIIIYRSAGNRQTDRQVDRWTGTQLYTGRQATGRQADRQMDRHIIIYR